MDGLIGQAGSGRSAAHVTLVVNPAAGRGRARRIAERARMDLQARGLPVRLLRTGLQDGAPIPVQLGDPGRAVVVCGGDGTVATALPSVVALAEAGRPVPLGILPAGTGNDFAGDLGVPRDPTAALTAIVADLAGGVRRPVDVGWLRPGPDGAPGCPFATVVACGFDSRVNERRNRSRWPLGPLAYPVAVLGELASFRPATYRLTVDGVTTDCEAVLVAVGNTATYGGGLRICPDARPDDGLLDVTIVRAVSRATLLRVFPRVYSGGHRRHPAVQLLRGRDVTVQELPDAGRRSARVVPVHADGEPVVPLPVTCSVRPGVLPMLGTVATGRVVDGAPAAAVVTDEE